MSQANLFNPPLPQQIPVEKIFWENLHGASLGLAISAALTAATSPLLIIVEDSLTTARLLDELKFFYPDEQALLYFPDWETLPYDHFSPHQDIISERLETLARLPRLNKGAVITTLTTLLNRLPPLAYLTAQSFILKVGDKLTIESLRGQLENSGYRGVSQVREHGEYAIRGAIIDLYPMGSALPFRIDLLDDEIDTLRTFSPETQRTLEKIQEVHLLPAKEFPLTQEAIELFRQAWRSQFAGNPLKSPIYQDVSEGISPPGIEYYLPLFFEKTSSIFDYLPDNSHLLYVGNIQQKTQEFWQEVTARYEHGRYDITRPLLNPSALFLAWTELVKATEKFSSITVAPQTAALTNHHFTFRTEAAPALAINHREKQPLAALQEFLATNKGRILFCAESIGRREVLLQLFATISLHPKSFSSWQDFLNDQENVGITVAPLEEGFSLPDPPITVITETQLYGKRVMQRRLRKTTAQDTESIIRDLTELQLDDPVVHLDHGIGRYRGLQTLTAGGQINEFVYLEYAEGDKLYVPVSALHLISRYTGTDTENVPLNKLGADNWKKAKKKAESQVRDVAAELLDIYAKRAARPGFHFKLTQSDYERFAAGFPFEETPDQLQAIENIITDMTTDKPMDRVVCGDVGFGKTEVALRAAFLAIQNNKQVAVLVPTTLLAQQHLQTFQDRFADWPVQVDMLSRFRSAKEKTTVLQKLASGNVDIVIGTHKLLQEDVQFKSLGLVIVDEEHRFGVRQKERLKALRASVDILTLTATPIPRTLNMAFSGIRDLSIIATPPARRLSVKTFLHEYQDSIIQEAIQREILRGGQVYFIHNDVLTISKKAQEISALAPEARIGIAHGQMHERELERVMSDFYHRHYNVLMCTTIVESGIDIPTANTIIINRADKFGLAQLHQLRGRVGRSHHQAYAYLLVPSRKGLSHDAEKRLDAITMHDELGIGFTLATHDLEIRGAGELLGEEQSGNMQEVGFTLYMDLLSRAVTALKAGKEPDFSETSQLKTEIDLHISALIPDSYLGDIGLRLQFYKRIANAQNEAQLDEIQVEMIDRFGLLPEPLKNLMAVQLLRFKAESLGILKLEANEKGGKIEFTEKPNVKPERIIYLIQNKTQTFRFDGPTRLRFILPGHEIKERVNLVDNIIEQLSPLPSPPRSGGEG